MNGNNFNRKKCNCSTNKKILWFNFSMYWKSKFRITQITCYVYFCIVIYVSLNNSTVFIVWLKCDHTLSVACATCTVLLNNLPETIYCGLWRPCHLSLCVWFKTVWYNWSDFFGFVLRRNLSLIFYSNFRHFSFI